ncbi:MAG: DUF6580 family putative transport protein [Planctomycetota bacterium]
MIYLLIIVAAASRFLPHPPNMVCLGAMGLFAGCYFRTRLAFLVPAAVLLASDLVGQAFGSSSIRLYSPMVMLGTYCGATLSVPLGRWLQRECGRASLAKLPLAAVGASTVFFLASNLAVWLGPWYPTSAAGLFACFSNAVPFYGYTLVGDLGYCSVMFGCYEFTRRYAGVSVVAPIVGRANVS